MILLIVVGCSCRQQPVQHFSGMAFGTFYNITYVGELSDALPRQVDSLLKEMNATFSILDTNSTISRINAGEEMEVNADFAHILQTSLALSKQTDGAFDCTIQPLVELWGFGREQQRHRVSQEEIDSVKQFVGSSLVTLQDRHVKKADPRVQLNFNAIVKGYAVDRVADLLQAQGRADCLVEIGGEVVARGTKNGKPWQVGIQIPTEQADGAIESCETFALQNQAVATSGSYRNYFEDEGIRYTHILNPVTGQPERSHLLSVTVIAPDCCTADAYATAFMVLGLERASAISRQQQLTTYFIYSENNTFKTIKVEP